MMSISIRSATREDCPQIAQLIKELADYCESYGEVQTAKCFERDGFDLETPLFQCLVVEETLPEQASSKRLVGYAVYFIGYTTRYGKEFHLDDVYLRAKYRKRGVGKSIFMKLCQEAISNDCQIFNLKAQNWNSTMGFYKKFGARDITSLEDRHVWALHRNDILKGAQGYIVE